MHQSCCLQMCFGMMLKEELSYRRLRSSPGILDHVPEAAVLSPLGRRSSWSHCTRLLVEPTEPRWAPSYVSQVDGCFPLMSIRSERHAHAHTGEKKTGQAGPQIRKYVLGRAMV